MDLHLSLEKIIKKSLKTAEISLFEVMFRNHIGVYVFTSVLWEVVLPLKGIFDIMTQDGEKRVFEAQNWSFLGILNVCLKVKCGEIIQKIDFFRFFQKYSKYQNMISDVSGSVLGTVRGCF